MAVRAPWGHATGSARQRVPARAVVVGGGAMLTFPIGFRVSNGFAVNAGHRVISSSSAEFKIFFSNLFVFVCYYDFILYSNFFFNAFLSGYGPEDSLQGNRGP